MPDTLDDLARELREACEREHSVYEARSWESLQEIERDFYRRGARFVMEREREALLAVWRDDRSDSDWAKVVHEQIAAIDAMLREPA